MNVLCVLGLLLLTSSCGAAPSSSLHYCVSPLTDSVDEYLASNSEDVAAGIIQNELVVLRDYDSQRYQLARKSAQACAVGYEVRSFDDLQQTLTSNVVSASYPPSTEWCTVAVPNVDQQEASALFRYLGLSGLKGVAVSTSERLDPATGERIESDASIRAADQCVAIQNLVDAMMERRREFSP